ncbi:MAG: hypothetical protein J0L99_14635 [Chitinophagales bacterium]|nr:hypothetical protein [Chitinophagales bacterium]
MNKTIRLSLILLFSCLPAMAQATIWYVNLNATGAQNGSSWADAFVSPQQGLSAAQAGDEVWVAKGVYYAYATSNIDPVYLKSGVRLLGGFSGNETADAQRNWVTNTTEVYTLNWHIFACDTTGPGTAIDGFTIRGANVYNYNSVTSELDCGPANGPQYGCQGGGMFIYNGDSTRTVFVDIRNCIFKNNLANEGGAIAIDLLRGPGHINIINCQFLQNKARMTGGAIWIATGEFENTSISIDSCSFTENSIPGMSFGGAAGVYILNNSEKAHFLLDNLAFINNTGTTWAGALGVESGTARRIKVSRSIFKGNKLGINQFVPGRGGAVAGFGMTFYDCSFIENKARWGGVARANADYYNCLFAENYAEKDGGVSDFSFSNKYITCTFVNNYAKDYGGALVLRTETDSLINCLFWGNKAGKGDDMIAPSYFPGTAYFFQNCAFQVPACDSLWAGGVPAAVSLECHNNLYNLNPVFRDTANGDYRLAPCSPLRNQGDSAAVARYGLLHDLAGLPRVLNGLPDIGAYETPALEANYTQFPITCHNANDGILQFQDLGGFGPYGFSWSDNAGTLNREYLAPGQYRLSVSDINNCKDTLEFTFDNPPPFFVMAEKQDVDAFGASNGWAAISQITGGEAPYTVTWDNGDTTLRLENLPAGEYTAYVRDRRGCDTILTLVVGTTVADSNPQNEAIAAFFVPSPCKTCILQPLRQGPDALEIPVSIYDLNGRLLYAYRGFVGNALPLPAQPPGLYVLRAGRQVLRYVQE